MSKGRAESGMDQTEPQQAAGGSGAKKRMIVLDDRLVAAAAEALRHPGGPTPTAREAISLAVQTYLPIVLERARDMGLAHWPGSTRRPRNLDNAAWAALAEATRQVPVGQIELLRCCLCLATRGGGAAETEAEAGGRRPAARKAR
jgi:hypothetical protein